MQSENSENQGIKQSNTYKIALLSNLAVFMDDTAMQAMSGNLRFEEMLERYAFFNNYLQDQLNNFFKNQKVDAFILLGDYTPLMYLKVTGEIGFNKDKLAQKTLSKQQLYEYRLKEREIKSLTETIFTNTLEKILEQEAKVYLVQGCADLEQSKLVESFKNNEGVTIVSKPRVQELTINDYCLKLVFTPGIPEHASQHPIVTSKQDIFEPKAFKANVFQEQELKTFFASQDLEQALLITYWPPRFDNDFSIDDFVVSKYKGLQPLTLTMMNRPNQLLIPEQVVIRPGQEIPLTQHIALLNKLPLRYQEFFMKTFTHIHEHLGYELPYKPRFIISSPKIVTHSIPAIDDKAVVMHDLQGKALTEDMFTSQIACTSTTLPFLTVLTINIEDQEMQVKVHYEKLETLREYYFKVKNS
ncbi:hypothetical protein J7L02_00460 [Candidatus Woesearchaeota archaeon]|nr:hypothetical protein [Candidatus Woesearchaeota archaeon]